MKPTARQLEAAKKIASLPETDPELYESLDFFRKEMVEFAQELLKQFEN